MQLEDLKQIPDSFWNVVLRDAEVKGSSVDLSRASKISVTRDTYLEAQAKAMSLTELLRDRGVRSYFAGLPT